MKHEAMTKDVFRQTLGAMNPVGYAVLAFADDATAAQVHDALVDAGFDESDILVFASSELLPRLDEMLRATSGTVGFGYEGVLMRRYLALAQEGSGWVVVHAPEDEDAKRVKEVAARFNAKSAVLYHTLASEDLL